jgi:predicted DNA-binding transcriptional regulator YafY
VTAARVARLYRLLRLLAAGPLTRPVLLRRLGLNQRGFYRDIELLRAVGIHVTPRAGRYSLEPGFEAAVELLPFPDPQLTLGEAQRLARGKTIAHRALQARVEQIVSTPPRKSR